MTLFLVGIAIGMRIEWSKSHYIMPKEVFFYNCRISESCFDIVAKHVNNQEKGTNDWYFNGYFFQSNLSNTTQKP
jgi:hypothetical protein